MKEGTAYTIGSFQNPLNVGMQARAFCVDEPMTTEGITGNCPGLSDNVCLCCDCLHTQVAGNI